MLHLEMWVALRKNRASMRRVLRKSYRIARQITGARGGSGPWIFLVDPDPPSPKTQRLRSLFGLKSGEDLWIEFVFYPNKSKMKKIIQRIWKHPRFMTVASGLDRLVSRRKVGFDATLAYAVLQNL